MGALDARPTAPAAGQGCAGRADGRCGAYRAFLDRLGHQARARGRDRTGAQPEGGTTAICAAGWTTTRRCAASRCSRSRTPRAIPPSGSRTSSRYAGLEPEQFAYSLLTRSQRISHENLRLRDKRMARGLRKLDRSARRRAGRGGRRPVLPMLTPYKARGLTLKNRVVVSPTLLYACKKGVPGDFHMVHLGSRALGGAGLVMVEMTAVSPDARITPGCPGLWNDEQLQAFAEITGFVHESNRCADRHPARPCGAARIDSARLGPTGPSACQPETGRSCRPRPCPTCPASRKRRGR